MRKNDKLIIIMDIEGKKKELKKLFQDQSNFTVLFIEKCIEKVTSDLNVQHNSGRFLSAIYKYLVDDADNISAVKLLSNNIPEIVRTIRVVSPDDPNYWIDLFLVDKPNLNREYLLNIF